MLNDEIEIEKLYKYYCGFDDQISLEELQEFTKLVQKISPALRQKYAYKLSRVMVEHLKRLNKWPETSGTPEGILLVNTIEILSVAQVEDEKRDAYQECLRFINDLRNTSKLSSNSAEKIVEQSRLFWDILPSIKNIFSLNTDNGERTFPIHELVLEAANHFQHDNEHLITLALAMQLFESVKRLETVQEEALVKKKVREIAKDYQIRFLEIVSEGGRLRFDPLDYQYNGTIRAISQDNRVVVIRNTCREYFSAIALQEVKPEAGQVAWYIERELSKEEELTSFKEIFEKGSKENRLKLLDYAFKERAYNIFLPEMLVRDRTSERFLRVINPCISADKYIVLNGQAETADIQGFLKNLKTGKINYRALPLCEDGIDILTIDFYCTFYLEVVQGRWDFWMDFVNEGTFYQRQLSSAFLLEMFDKQSVRNFAKTLSDYYVFLKNYVSYTERDSTTKMDRQMCLMMPYGCALPDDISEEKWNQKILHEWFAEDADDWQCEELNFDKQIQHFVTPEGDVLENYTFYSEDDFNLEISPITLAKKRQKYYFINHKRRKIIPNYISDDVKKRINGIKDLAKEEVIVYEKKYDYAIDNIARLHSIMERNMLKQEMYSMYGCEKGEREKEQCIRLFKILWHFQIYNICKERVNDFWALVLKKHYLGCIEQDEVIESYFAELKNKASESGTLVVAKETSGDDTTLWNIYNLFGKKDGKNLLVKAFSSDSINIDLKKNGQNGYLWRGKPLKKVIFMVDNTLSGSSLKKMLKFHLEGDIPKTKYKYVNLKPSLKEMLQNDNSIEVEVHIIFALLSDEAIAEIKEQYENIELIIYNQISESYRVDSKTVELIKRLYGIDKDIGGSFIFRYCNMPAKYAFPEEVVESLNLVGLFQRRTEV